MMMLMVMTVMMKSVCLCVPSLAYDWETSEWVPDPCLPSIEMPPQFRPALPPPRPLGQAGHLPRDFPLRAYNDDVMDYHTSSHDLEECSSPVYEEYGDQDLYDTLPAARPLYPGGYSGGYLGGYPGESRASPACYLTGSLYLPPLRAWDERPHSWAPEVPPMRAGSLRDVGTLLDRASPSMPRRMPSSLRAPQGSARDLSQYGHRY